MHARLLFATLALLSTSALGAEPAKPETQPPARPETSAPKVVLASANIEQPQQPSAEQAPATPKRRVGRVTSCRCGDQQAEPEEE